MKCPLCKGSMVEGKTILPYELGGGKVIVVLDVPALVCEQCGDDFVVINVMRNVELMLKKIEQDGVRMGFVGYEKAA